MTEQSACVLIFTKSPIEGEVKTRLIPVIGDKKATEIYRNLIVKTVNTTVNSVSPDICIWTAPDISHPLISELSNNTGAQIKLQIGENLGERMLNAIEDASVDYNEIVIIGCDCPELNEADLLKAIELLRSDTDIVIGPSDDGGYYLLGCKNAYPELFNDIDWGSENVLTTTLERIKKAGLSYDMLEEKWDLDTVEDLQRYEALINNKIKGSDPLII